MFRSKTILLKRAVIAVSIDLPCVQNAGGLQQQTRNYRPRKPAYSGIAKTKLFRIPSRPNLETDEKAEIIRLANNYRLYMRCISNHFVVEGQSQAEGSFKAFQSQEAEEAEWQESLLRVKQWNDECAAIRNERLTRVQREKEQAIRERILEEERSQAERLKQIEELVRREKEISKSYITSENIDLAIETALGNVIDFNYAIDRRGTKYEGRFVNATGEEEMPEEEEIKIDSVSSVFHSNLNSIQNQL